MRLKIGEFAAFCNISVRTLRHYDSLGLLKPAEIDPDTGYRSYEPEQMQTLNAILTYKKMGFSLQEIKELVSPAATSAELIRRLTDKLKENKKRADACDYHNESIRRMLDAYRASPAPESDQDAAVRLSRIACLENETLENEFSQILWL